MFSHYLIYVLISVMLSCLLQPLATEQSLGLWVFFHRIVLERFPETFQWQIPHSLTLAEEWRLEFNKGSGEAKACPENLGTSSPSLFSGKLVRVKHPRIGVCPGNICASGDQGPSCS